MSQKKSAKQTRSRPTSPEPQPTSSRSSTHTPSTTLHRRSPALPTTSTTTSLTLSPLAIASLKEKYPSLSVAGEQKAKGRTLQEVEAGLETKFFFITHKHKWRRNLNNFFFFFK